MRTSPEVEAAQERVRTAILDLEQAINRDNPREGERLLTHFVVVANWQIYHDGENEASDVVVYPGTTDMPRFMIHGLIDLGDTNVIQDDACIHGDDD